MKLYGRGKYFIIRNSMFDIRYFFGEHGKYIFLELLTAEELAKHLPASLVDFASVWDNDLSGLKPRPT
jgi:hypothetical protein